MSRARPKISLLDVHGGGTAVSVRIGVVVNLDPKGRPVVDYQGNPAGPLVARSVVILPREKLTEPIETLQVLLLFADGDAQAPVIVGVLGDYLFAPGAVEETDLPAARPREVLLDGERILLAADREIELRCGKSSITMTREGRVVVKGTEIVSRAARTNKIKGGTVSIN